MAVGLLRVTGTIDIRQFWPEGDSDADTTKVVVGEEAFAFRKGAAGPFVVTHAFDGATVKGRVRKAPVDAKGRLTIRLQAIDTPELHYDPMPAGKLSAADQKAFTAAKAGGEFRQRLGETATLALVKMLKKAGVNPIPCTVVSAVATPNDVFDTYARMVGEIVVKIGGRNVNVNEWLASSGWAFPTYYTSMSDAEISNFDKLAAKALAKKAGVWRSYSKDATKFDFKLRYRRKGEPDAKADAGQVIMPKLYRRQSSWAVGRKAGVTTGSFTAYLTAHAEACFGKDDFLEQGVHAATLRTIADFMKGAGTFKGLPQDLVFREAASKVVGPDGKPAAW